MLEFIRPVVTVGVSQPSSFMAAPRHRLAYIERPVSTSLFSDGVAVSAGVVALFVYTARA